MGLSAWGMVLSSPEPTTSCWIRHFRHWILYGMTTATVLVLRRKGPIFRAPTGHSVTPRTSTVCREAAAIVILRLYNRRVNR